VKLIIWFHLNFAECGRTLRCNLPNVMQVKFCKIHLFIFPHSAKYTCPSVNTTSTGWHLCCLVDVMLRCVDNDEQVCFNVALSPKTARTCNKLTTTVKSCSSQCNEMFLVWLKTAVRSANSLVFRLLRKTCSDDRTDSSKLF